MPRTQQLDLFAGGAPAQTAADAAHAAAALAQMRDAVQRLQSATEPPWKDYMASLLECGAFRRAMQLVPGEVSEALWLAFEAQVHRLWAIWDDAEEAAQISTEPAS